MRVQSLLMLVAMSILAVALLGASAPDTPSDSPVLLVDVAADRDLTCRAGERLAVAIRQRLPGVRVERAGEAQARGQDLTATLVPGRDHWSLTLTHPDGETALVRQLEMPAGGCQSLVDASALIVDRFLIALDWPGLPVFIDPFLVTVPGEPEPHASGSQSEPESVAPDLPLIDRWYLGLSPAVRVGLDPPSIGGGGVLEAGVLTRLGVRAGVQLLLYLPVSHPVVLDDEVLGAQQLGSLEEVSLALLGSVGFCSDRRLSVCLDGLVGATMTRASLRGRDLPKRRSTTTWRPAVGLAGGIEYSLPWWQLAVTAALQGLARIDPPEFTVDGIVDGDGSLAPVLESPPIELVVRLGLTKSF